VLVGREARMADNRAIAEASRSLIKHLKRVGDGNAIVPAVLQSFYRKLGDGDAASGINKMGECLLEDFNKSRGDDLSDKEREIFERKDGVIQKYYQMLLDTSRRDDETKNIDVSGLTDEDLTATVIDTCLKIMLEDEVLQKRFLNRLFSMKPGLLAEIMEMGGKVVFDVPAEKHPSVIEYDESTGDE
jgi:hypothetical protein